MSVIIIQKQIMVNLNSLYMYNRKTVNGSEGIDKHFYMLNDNF